VSVDTATSSYVVKVRPWHLASGDHGQFTVHTDKDTSFEIDGVTSMGAEGLSKLAAEAAGTLTVAFGTLDTSTREFTASMVLAGTSVDGEGFDAVQGNVVSRDGDTITIKGAFAVHRDHRCDFPRTVIVTVGMDTKVIEAGSTDVLNEGAISVGQNIVAFGTLTEPTTTPSDSTGTMGTMSSTAWMSPKPSTPSTLDATAGRVRLQPTEVRGTVKTVVPGTLAMPGTLTMQLRSIDRLGVDMFDFTGTGSDPTSYRVGTGSLSLAGLSPGEATKVIGFVTPFGKAPPDFDGRTVIDHRDLPSVLGINWSASSMTPLFLSMNSTGLVIDNKNSSIGDRHYIQSGMNRIDILTLASGPTIAPTTDRGIYGVWEPGHIELFESFADFETKLAARLGAGDALTSMTAVGAYDSGTNTLTANGVSAFFGKIDSSLDEN
jgi:hypothetical protein